MSDEIIRKHVFLCDVHTPHHINLSGVKKFLQVYQPTDFIIGGDFANLESVSHWNQREFSQIGFEKLSGMFYEEMEVGKSVLKELTSTLPKDCAKYYIPGNHEAWLYQAALAYPQLAGSVKLGVSKMNFRFDLAQIRKQVIADLIKKHLETDKLGIKVLPFGKELVLNRVTYMHGHQFSSMTAMQRKYPGRNVVVGHHHTEKTDTIHNSGNPYTITQYTMVPCLCNLGPGYLDSPSTKWLNGFYCCEVLSDGTLNGHVEKVLNGRVVFGGVVYK